MQSASEEVSNYPAFSGRSSTVSKFWSVLCGTISSRYTSTSLCRVWARKIRFTQLAPCLTYFTETNLSCIVSAETKHIKFLPNYTRHTTDRKRKIRFTQVAPCLTSSSQNFIFGLVTSSAETSVDTNPAVGGRRKRIGGKASLGRELHNRTRALGTTHPYQGFITLHSERICTTTNMHHLYIACCLTLPHKNNTQTVKKSVRAGMRI